MPLMPVGEVGVLAADVVLAEAVLDDAGRADQHLLERRVLAAGMFRIWSGSIV